VLPFAHLSGFTGEKLYNLHRLLCPVPVWGTARSATITGTPPHLNGGTANNESLFHVQSIMQVRQTGKELGFKQNSCNEIQPDQFKGEALTLVNSSGETPN